MLSHPSPPGRLLGWDRQVPRLAFMIHQQQRGAGCSFMDVSIDVFRATNLMTIHFQDDVSRIESCFRRSRIVVDTSNGNTLHTACEARLPRGFSRQSF